MAKLKILSSTGNVYRIKEGGRAATSTDESWPGTIFNLGKFQVDGNSLAECFVKMADVIDQIVKTHIRKPPHLTTEQDKEIAESIYEVVDLDKFDIDNPIEQPLTGKILRKFKNGALLVEWEYGPDESGIDKLDSQNVHPILHQSPIGSIFYGSGKVYEDDNLIEWTTTPTITEPTANQENKDATIKALKDKVAQLQNLLFSYQQSAAKQYRHNQDYHPYGDDEYDR